MIQTRLITGDHPGPHLLITGGVHGDEFEPMAAVRRLMQNVKPGELRGRLTLVPVVNEPAFLRGHRTAEDGLDLARTCPGRPDGSITERIAHELTQLIRSADYYIDLHTGGTKLAVLPLTGYVLHADAAVLAVQRRMARAFNLPVIWGTDPNLNGRSLSVARDARVPAIYAEYRGSGVCDPAGVEAYVTGCRKVMVELDMLDGDASHPALEYEIEDARPSAGHMQICYPSPLTGFFAPTVRLGDGVSVGEPLGAVSDVLGARTETIRSVQNGNVLVLHTFSMVVEGESVGVVLEKPVNM